MYRISWIVVVGITVASAPSAPAGEGRVVEEIRVEAVRFNHGEEGRPLPLASHWNCGKHPNSKGWGPEQQLALIEQGHFILPWFAHPPLDAALSQRGLDSFRAYYEGPIKKARQLRLPLVFVAGQWEHLLSAEPYLGLPPERNPNVVDTEGKVLPQVSPFGPVSPWKEVGTQWTANPQMRQLQQWYPDPPRVIFLSNNEHAKLTWPKVEQSRRYLEKYGKGRDDDFKRKVVGDGWIERYRALQEGMREGLATPAWRKAATFVGYEAFGPEFVGRWPGWPAYSLHTAGRISPYPLMWDGGSPSYYTHDWNPSTDHTTWSPQIEFMNLVFCQQEAYRLNPEFWLELSVWDGYDGPARARQYPPKREVYRKAGQVYGPERYAGFVQFGMWLLRPRAVREYRGWTFPAEEGMPYFRAIVAAVDHVHANPVLREFWRKGQLVPNRAHQHPYQAGIPKEYAGVDRWFLLDADVNPRGQPWRLSQSIPVFSLALVRGSAPKRQWLVYAHAPLGDRQGVKLSLPGYGAASVDVSTGGSFFVVDEKAKSVTPVR